MSLVRSKKWRAFWSGFHSGWIKANLIGLPIYGAVLLYLLLKN